MPPHALLVLHKTDAKGVCIRPSEQLMRRSPNLPLTTPAWAVSCRKPEPKIAPSFNRAYGPEARFVRARGAAAASSELSVKQLASVKIPSAIRTQNAPRSPQSRNCDPLVLAPEAIGAARNTSLYLGPRIDNGSSEFGSSSLQQLFSRRFPS